MMGFFAIVKSGATLDDNTLDHNFEDFEAAAQAIEGFGAGHDVIELDDSGTHLIGRCPFGECRVSTGG